MTKRRWKNWPAEDESPALVPVKGNPFERMAVKSGVDARGVKGIVDRPYVRSLA